MLTRALVSVLVILATTSCGPSAPGKAPARPGAALMASGQVTDAALADFLGQVVSAVEGHDWPGLLAFCDPEHRATQLGELGQDRATYLAEILGLHTVDNSLGDVITEAELATITRLEISDVTTDAAGDHTVTGWVVLASGARLRLTMRVTPGPAHGLTGALG